MVEIEFHILLFSFAFVAWRAERGIRPYVSPPKAQVTRARGRVTRGKAGPPVLPGASKHFWLPVGFYHPFKEPLEPHSAALCVFSFAHWMLSSIFISAFSNEGDATQQPPPDLPSYLFKNRIFFLGMSLVPAVTMTEFLLPAIRRPLETSLYVNELHRHYQVIKSLNWAALNGIKKQWIVCEVSSWWIGLILRMCHSNPSCVCSRIA